VNGARKEKAMASIDEATAARIELERELLGLITKFENDYGMWVQSIESMPRETVGKEPPQTSYLKVDVRL